VIDHQRPLVARAVRIGKTSSLTLPPQGHRNRTGKKFSTREQVAAMQQRKDLSLVPLDQAAIRLLGPVRTRYSMRISRSPFDLAVAEHRQAGQGRHQRTDAKYYRLAELIYGRPLIRLFIEIHISPEESRGRKSSVFLTTRRYLPLSSCGAACS